ncbi:hypothetical protein DMZ48_10360 [Robertkochia solimangrovi]|nr:hypothetical protein DMZ48_10360 [Robertkochia solimangrovi]
MSVTTQTIDQTHPGEANRFNGTNQPEITSTVNNDAMHVVLDNMVYIEEEQPVELGFDTAQYLPEGFDPYIGNLNDIEYIDLDEIEVEFDTDLEQYLPENFDPHVGDLNSIMYIDLEEQSLLELAYVH